MDADLVIPAGDADALREIASWDGFRPATFAAADFPVDVVRFAQSSSRPVVLSHRSSAPTLASLEPRQEKIMNSTLTRRPLDDQHHLFPARSMRR
jgi:hypothetical protein